MTTCALPQFEDFSAGDGGKMGSVNGDYAATSTVTYPAGSGDYITGGKALKSVHDGDQTLKALLQFDAGQAEVYMGFWMKAIMTGTVNTSTFYIASISNGAQPVARIKPNLQNNQNHSPRLVFEYYNNGGTYNAYYPAGELFDNKWHHVLLRWLYGAGNGRMQAWIDNFEIFLVEWITGHPDHATADRAGIDISSVHANNEIEFWFDQFRFTTTLQDRGDGANIIIPKRANIHV